MVSMIVPTFARRPLVAHLATVLSLIATGFLAFGLWVHHMFATGLPRMGDSFFTAASMTIAIPSGVQMFAWIATLWAGRPSFKTPLLFVLGFIVIFTIGGLTGVMLASVPLDLQVHDTYFVVAHFHYVLIGGAVFPLFAGFYYWFPKMTGYLYDERLAKWHFWVSFVGINLAFFPQHFLGFQGMPRRVVDYTEAYAFWNFVSSIGAFIGGAGTLVFVYLLYEAFKAKRPAPANPWGPGATTLEWTLPSPPPFHTWETPPHIVDEDHHAPAIVEHGSVA
jgi:cytochrome c oxidase subunit 1